MSKSDHLEALRLLSEDPRVIDRSIDRAHQLRAEAFAAAWRLLRDQTRRLIRRAAIRRPAITAHHSECRAPAQS